MPSAWARQSWRASSSSGGRRAGGRGGIVELVGEHGSPFRDPPPGGRLQAKQHRPLKEGLRDAQIFREDQDCQSHELPRFAGTPARLLGGSSCFWVLGSENGRAISLAPRVTIARYRATVEHWRVAVNGPLSFWAKGLGCARGLQDVLHALVADLDALSLHRGGDFP